MKMSKQRYAELRDGIRNVVDHVGGPARVREAFAAKSDTAMLWALLHQTTHDFMYDDTHPAYSDGPGDRKARQRINPHKGFRWNLYHDNGQELNDAHIGTALKRIGKELGLTV